VHECGTMRTDEDCHVWNRFIAKLGWRDDLSHVLSQRIIDRGLAGKSAKTIIDPIDEGQDPVAQRAWENS
jgi:hypothetical protein